MFVSQEARLEVSLEVARARLSNLIRGGQLISASEDAYGAGLTGLMRVGPGGAEGLSRLVSVRFQDLVTRGEAAVLALRWEASGPAGGLFPALDADLTLTPAGGKSTVLRMDGAYRPPLGALGAMLDRAVMHRVATATIRSFIGHVAEALVHPAPSPLAQHASRNWHFLTALEAEDA